MKRPNSFVLGPLAFVISVIAIVPASMARTGSDDYVAHTRRPDAFLALLFRIAEHQDSRNPNPHQLEWECTDIKTTPPESDKDPISKVNVSITENERGPIKSEVEHTTVSGKVTRRSEQYEQYRLRNDLEGYVWRGYSPELNVYMLGRLYFVATHWYYHEALRQGADGRPGKLLMFMDSACRFTD
jgi:hypothetical protein